MSAAERAPTPRPGRRWAAIAIVAVAPLLLVGLFVGATYTPLFRVRTVRIEGAGVVGRQEIIRLAGLDSATNVFHLDTVRAADAIAADPWVATAIVARDLPSTVVVTITERAPIARMLQGQTDEAVAGDGVLLPGAPTAGLPEIRGALGDLSDADRVAAAQALAALGPSIRHQVSAAVMEVGDDLRLQFVDGTSVEFGQGGDAVAKAGALRSVLRWASEQGVAVRSVDVSVPGAPAATLANGSAFPG